MHRALPLVLLAAAAAVSQAQTAPKQAPQKPAVPMDKYLIGMLKVEGNANYTAAQVLHVAGLKVGDWVSRRDFENARERLLATGAFETVGYSFEPDAAKRIYVATFRVAETNPVFPIHFEDLAASDAELLKVLQERDPLFNAAKTPAVRTVIDRYAGWIGEYLSSKADAKSAAKTVRVAGEVTQLAPGELSIVFRPATARPVVARVFFEGNKLIPESLLQEAVWSVGVGTPWTEANFRLVLDASIRPLYEARGHLRVSFPTLKVEPVTDVHGVKVTVTVDEGEEYKLAKVEIAGTTPMNPEDLLRAGDFKTGAVANFDKIGDGLDRIRTALKRAGYLNATAGSSRIVDDAKQSVAVTITVDAGQLYKMGTLQIKGLDLEAEAEIKRIWTLKEGSAFDPEYPDYFLKRVGEDGIFDNLGETKADSRRNEKDHIVDVTLTFGGIDPAQRITGRRPGRGRGQR